MKELKEIATSKGFIAFVIIVLILTIIRSVLERVNV